MAFRGVQYYIKKGIMFIADEFENYLLHEGSTSKDPVIMNMGMSVAEKNNQFREALYNRSDLEYLDKKIRQECKERVKRQEYLGLSNEERERADAMWRQKRWKEEGLDEKRKKLGIDSSIDENKPKFEKFVMQKDKKVFAKTSSVAKENLHAMER